MGKLEIRGAAAGRRRQSLYMYRAPFADFLCTFHCLLLSQLLIDAQGIRTYVACAFGARALYMHRHGHGTLEFILHYFK